MNELLMRPSVPQRNGKGAIVRRRNRWTTVAIVAAVAALLALVAAGCGGSKSSEGTTSTAQGGSSGSGNSRQGCLRLLRPVAHVHFAVHRQGRVQMLLRSNRFINARIVAAKAEMGMGQVRPRTELVGKRHCCLKPAHRFASITVTAT